MKEAMKETPGLEPQGKAPLSRRKFLGYAGAIAGAGLVIASCNKTTDEAPTPDNTIDLGTNDTGLLNLLFVLQQLEAGFYERVIYESRNWFEPHDWEVFYRMRDHEIVHREFVRNYLKGNGSVVTFNYDTIKFNDRSNTLEHAELFENLVVGTMNEIGRLLISGEHVGVVAKMLAVDARHATTMSSMRNQESFLGTVDVTGSEPGISPSNCIVTLNKFLDTKISGNNLPNK